MVIHQDGTNSVSRLYLTRFDLGFITEYNIHLPVFFQFFTVLLKVHQNTLNAIYEKEKKKNLKRLRPAISIEK